MTNLHAPWNFIQGDERNPMNAAIRDARGHLVCFRAVVDDDDRAVMTTIAAAPELQEVCHKIIDNWGNLHSKDLAQLRAAVAKAEGRTMPEPDTSGYWTRFDQLKAAALATDDGKVFAAHGFEFFHNGGGCTAWRKSFRDGRYIMVTSSEGHNHAPEGDGESYMAGFYASTEDVDGIVSHDHTSAESVIGAAMHFVMMDAWETAGRRAGWRSGDTPGTLLKNIAGATTANIFLGDWKALCLNQGLEVEGRADG